MTYEPGDIVFVPFPYTNLESSKQRPALVLSRPVHGGRDLILCAITSKLDNTDQSVLIEQPDMATGKLPRPSRIKAAKLQTLHVDLIRKRLGRVRPAVMEQVRKELRAILRA